MAENKDWEQDFTKGYNEGYLIARHEPSLADKLTKSLNDTSRSQGFKEGITQAKIEKAKEYQPSYLKPKSKPDREITPKKENEKGIDRD